MTGRPPVVRVLWLALGLLCAGGALVGVVVPVLPTAPFALASAATWLWLRPEPPVTE